MSTIQIRIDQKEKKEVKRILDNIGLDFSSAIKLYFKQIRKYRGIPYILTENGLTPQEEAEILLASTEAKSGKGLSKKMNLDEFRAYLKSL